MKTVNPYLTFDGNCEAAFNFYKSVFGGEFAHLGRFSEIPQDADGPPISKEHGEKIMHVSLPISKETVLMGSDAHPSFGKPSFGDTMSIAIRNG